MGYEIIGDGMIVRVGDTKGFTPEMIDRLGRLHSYFSAGLQRVPDYQDKSNQDYGGGKK